MTNKLWIRSPKNPPKSAGPLDRHTTEKTNIDGTRPPPRRKRKAKREQGKWKKRDQQTQRCSSARLKFCTFPRNQLRRIPMHPESQASLTTQFSLFEQAKLHIEWLQNPVESEWSDPGRPKTPIPTDTRQGHVEIFIVHYRNQMLSQMLDPAPCVCQFFEEYFQTEIFNG
jgi:hypothetical protein